MIQELRLNNAMLTVKNLSLTLKLPNKDLFILDNINFSIKSGRSLALIGESGCGKSMTANSIMRLLPGNAYYSRESDIQFSGRDLLDISEKDMQLIRGSQISMIFQDPMSSLNPVLSIKEQMYETIRLAGLESNNAIRDRALQLLAEVKLKDPIRCLRSYPHELSGGMKQRVMIAMMIAAKPRLLIADEPTTALDVITQMDILKLIQDLQKSTNMSLLLITHDLGIAKMMTDDIAIMYAGTVVEYASKDKIFESPRHPYTKRLLSANPNYEARDKKLLEIPGHVPELDKKFTKCRFLSRCHMKTDACDKVLPVWDRVDSHETLCHNTDKIESKISADRIHRNTIRGNAVLKIKDYKVRYPIKSGFFHRTTGYLNAVNNISLSLKESEILAVVGESGSGKTTLAKSILGLINVYSGEAVLSKTGITIRSKNNFLKEVQMIFQDPYSSLDPKFKISDILHEAVKKSNFTGCITSRLLELLNMVGMKESDLDKYPHEFSGGQKQRICIARALAVEPKIIVCDEPTSALDMSIQAQILNLLLELRQTQKLSYIFITHDISVVSYVADYVAVMQKGAVVEYGKVAQILHSPTSEYTKKLLKSSNL